jgi:DNA polymerase III subunit gamma/tau
MDSATPYRVLARKYRPQTFDDLIGQEPMVRTLSNAFAKNRIHQAYIFTGVRGVGKTTTARILARAFNYEKEDGTGGPTIDLSIPGRHCQSIIDGRHPDVVEMDAASNTGIDDIREIIESAQYRPLSARNKVFIIDEVHMLSKSAFNGLLKTLEEPPPHVKFLFATTEIRKVPVTVLSRCQRFDLRRVELPVLTAHLAKICAKESVEVEEEALRIIGRASEGSVRDSLSLLDQAIAHGAGETMKVEADGVRQMLGLADRTRIIDLFEALMKGDMPLSLGRFKGLYDDGADPLTVITDLAEYVHNVTRIKLTPDAAKDESLSESERQRGAGFARDLPIRVLTRAWQILLKGVQEVQGSERPYPAAEMLLVRLAYAADLPTPDDLIRKLAAVESGASAVPSGSGRSSGGPTAMTEILPVAVGQSRPMLASSNPAPMARLEQAPAKPAVVLESFAALYALAQEKRDVSLSSALERYVRPVRFEPGIFEFEPADNAPSDLANAIKRSIDQMTSMRWAVAISREKGEPTILERRREKEEEEERGVRAWPAVKAVLAAFPGAQIINIRKPDEAPPPKSDDALVETGSTAADIIYEDITDEDL